MIRRTTTAPRRGFTLVEILVVIGIIAVLASLIVVVTPRVIRSGKNTATATEIAQISNAIAAYKAKMNVGYIPSCGGGPGGTFQLKATYTGTEPEAVYLKQVWPQLNLTATGLPNANLDGNQTLVFFLTGGEQTKFQGFSANRVSPFNPPLTSDETRVGPFLEFGLKRYSNTVGTAPGQWSLLDTFGSPFAYFAYNPTTRSWLLPGGGSQTFAFNSTSVQPYTEGSGTGMKYLNATGFQIISAGDNGPDDSDPRGFGPGGFDAGPPPQSRWTPGAGAYAEGGSGHDDLSNFNSGVLAAK